SHGSPGDDINTASVQGRRFDSSGSPIGSQFQVNTYTTGNQLFSSVASDSSGNFVVVWESYGSVGGDVSGSSIQGQRYDASGAAVATNFQVNTYTPGNQFVPSVASDSNGNFVVVWESYGSAGGDISGASIQGQRYAASGAAVGTQFQVNTY